MKQYQVVITPCAGDNIRAAHDRLATENPAYAAKWLEGIKGKIHELEIMPESHPIALESTTFDCEIRQLLFGRSTPWRIFYNIDKDTVYILHVRHGRRDGWQS